MAIIIFNSYLKTLQGITHPPFSPPRFLCSFGSDAAEMFFGLSFGHRRPETAYLSKNEGLSIRNRAIHYNTVR